MILLHCDDPLGWLRRNAGQPSVYPQGGWPEGSRFAWVCGDRYAPDEGAPVDADMPPLRYIVVTSEAQMRELCEVPTQNRRLWWRVTRKLLCQVSDVTIEDFSA